MAARTRGPRYIAIRASRIRFRSGVSTPIPAASGFLVDQALLICEYLSVLCGEGFSGVYLGTVGGQVGRQADSLIVVNTGVLFDHTGVEPSYSLHEEVEG